MQEYRGQSGTEKPLRYQGLNQRAPLATSFDDVSVMLESGEMTKKIGTLNMDGLALPRVHVVVLNYNGWQDTIACVESLLRLDPPAAQIVVVDNGSEDDSIERLHSWARGEFVPQLAAPDPAIHKVPVPKPLIIKEDTLTGLAEHPYPGDPASLVLLRNDTNTGYAAGNNRGIRYAMARGADAVWILNNDTVVRPDALGAMVARLFSKQRPGLCGSLLRYFHAPNLVQCRGGGFTSHLTLLSRRDGQNVPLDEALSESPDVVEERLNFIYGASVMASRAFVETVGLMDEGFFLYSEEQDWAFSAKGQFDLAYAPEAHVLHKEGASTGWPACGFNPRILYRLTRSRLRLAIRQCPLSLPLVGLGIGFAVMRMVWRKATNSRVTETNGRSVTSKQGARNSKEA